MTAVVTHLGVAKGLRLFREMLERLDNGGEPIPGSSYALGEQCQLEEEYRPGLVFRNLAAEHLARAQRLGPDVAAAFLACTTDLVALAMQGFSVDSGRYDSLNSRDLGRYLAGAPAPLEEVEP